MQDGQLAGQSKSQPKTLLISLRNCGQMVDFCTLPNRLGGQMFFLCLFSTLVSPVSLQFCHIWFLWSFPLHWYFYCLISHLCLFPPFGYLYYLEYQLSLFVNLSEYCWLAFIFVMFLAVGGGGCFWIWSRMASSGSFFLCLPNWLCRKFSAVLGVCLMCCLLHVIILPVWVTCILYNLLWWSWSPLSTTVPWVHSPLSSHWADAVDPIGIDIKIFEVSLPQSFFPACALKTDDVCHHYLHWYVVYPLQALCLLQAIK